MGRGRKGGGGVGVGSRKCNNSVFKSQYRSKCSLVYYSTCIDQLSPNKIEDVQFWCSESHASSQASYCSRKLVMMTVKHSLAETNRPGGVTFTQYGWNECPDTNGTERLYSGRIVGSAFEEGGSSEYTCLPDDMEFHERSTGGQFNRTQLYETEFYRLPNPNLTLCAVCYTPARMTKATIPARISCPESWTLEYSGYYMTAPQLITQITTTPVCMGFEDQTPSAIASDGLNMTSLLHFMEVVFLNVTEIACAVCTK